MSSSESFLASVIILFSCIATLDGAIKCYECTMAAPSPYLNKTTRLCSHFNHSDFFIVDCPYSTLCMKKQFSINIAGTINGTARGCAYQRYEYQNLKNGKWHLEVAVQEPYVEGCSMSDNKGLKISQTEYCYCRGDLCNGAEKLRTIAWTLPVIYLTKLLYMNAR